MGREFSRAEFEACVDTALGGVLANYGFTLTPQRPAMIRSTEPWAVYEASVPAFRRSLPGIAQDMHLDEVDCVDLTVHWVDSRGVLMVDLEGLDLGKILHRVGLKPPAGETLQATLDQTAAALARAFPLFAA